MRLLVLKLRGRLRRELLHMRRLRLPVRRGTLTAPMQTSEKGRPMTQATRTMLDGIIVGDVTGAIAKTGTTIVAGYVDGRWPDYDQMVAKTPGLLHLPISVDPTNIHATVLDVETGDAAPLQAPAWVLSVRYAGGTPWVYCNADTWPAVREAFQNANVPDPYYWIADYDENPAIPAGAVAKQHTNTLGYDISSVIAYIAGFDPDPFKGHSDREDEMPVIEPLTVHPGEYAWGIDPAAGQTEVSFNCDGYGTQAELRVVIWDKDGCQVHGNVVIGGSGNAPAAHQTTVKFSNPTSTYGITVRRLDHTGIPIGVAFR